MSFFIFFSFAGEGSKFTKLSVVQNITYPRALLCSEFRTEKKVRRNLLWVLNMHVLYKNRFLQAVIFIAIVLNTFTVQCCTGTNHVTLFKI